MSLPPPADVAIAALRWLEYAGLLGFIGVIVVRRLAAMPPATHWARVSMQPALAAAFTGGVAVLVAESLRTGHLSSALVVRVAAEGVALVLCLYVHRWPVPPAIVAVLALPFAGHAALVNPAAGAIFVDAIHVLSAGAWAGGILVLATLRPPTGWGGGEGRAMLQRFGRVAFLAFAITALTGALRGTEELHGLSDLWGTPYGVVLSLKTAGVLSMVAISALMWRRAFRYSRFEAVLVLVVLAFTSMLAAFPMPPGQA
ncbi:MAG TPA: CopD family protein [Candidatus Dormibacteraeota bacterium]